jgi:hypothetical protein
MKPCNSTPCDVAISFEHVLLDQDCLPFILPYLQLNDIVALTEVSWRLHAAMHARQHLWAGLARKWALPLHPHTATLARVGAILRMTQLQVVAVKQVALTYGNQYVPPGPLPNTDSRASKTPPQYMQMAINVGCVAFTTTPTPCAAPHVPSRMPFAIFNMRSRNPRHRVFSPPAVVKALSVFQRTINWRLVRGWTFDVPHCTVVLYYRRTDGQEDGQVTLRDTLPQLQLITRLFRIYTDLAVFWRRRDFLLE